jgi:hypothetical protein
VDNRALIAILAAILAGKAIRETATEVGVLPADIDSVMQAYIELAIYAVEAVEANP